MLALSASDLCLVPYCPAATGTEATYMSASGWIITVPLEEGVNQKKPVRVGGNTALLQKARLIAVYIGKGWAVTDALVRVLGPQFAGGQPMESAEG